ncbi:unnamed protein product, partial [Cladocopium goreaui]
KIKTILDRIQIRKWIGPSAKINVEFLSACRDWKGWLDRHLPVTFRGGLKKDSVGHHAFIFLRRVDVPRNIVIKYDDRHGPLIPHDMDVIAFVKKNAADTHLGQEAILAMPFQFVQPILHSAPDSARPLKKVDPGKGKKYLELADILLRRFPSSTSGRSIEFLVDLCRNRNPGPLAPIPFYSTPGQQDLVVIPANPGLARVAPTIRFEAMLQRRP